MLPRVARKRRRSKAAPARPIAGEALPSPTGVLIPRARRDPASTSGGEPSSWSAWSEKRSEGVLSAHGLMTVEEPPKLLSWKLPPYSEPNELAESSRPIPSDGARTNSAYESEEGTPRPPTCSPCARASEKMSSHF
eukprot:scaffold21168_cov35-Tisochrysis_lutea.AAC.8